MKLLTECFQVPCGRCVSKWIECQIKPRARRTSRAPVWSSQHLSDLSGAKKHRKSSKSSTEDNSPRVSAGASRNLSTAALASADDSQTGSNFSAMPGFSGPQNSRLMNHPLTFADSDWNSLLESSRSLEDLGQINMFDVIHELDQTEPTPRTSLDSIMSFDLMSPVTDTTPVSSYCSTPASFQNSESIQTPTTNFSPSDNVPMDSALQNVTLNMEWMQTPATKGPQSYFASNQLQDQQDRNPFLHRSSTSSSSSSLSRGQKPNALDASDSKQPRGRLIDMTQNFINEALSKSQNSGARVDGIQSSTPAYVGAAKYSDRTNITLGDVEVENCTLPKAMIRQLLEILQAG